MENFKNDFDFSELEKSHELYDLKKKKVIGKMKIETSLIIKLVNFVALTSKLYAYSFTNMQSTFVKKMLNEKESKSLPRRKVILIHYLILKQQLQLIILSVQMLTI